MQFQNYEYQKHSARLSRPALLVVSVLHIAFFWLLLQTAPVQRVVRETVVMLNLPITQPLPKPPPKKIITIPKPPEFIKPIEKPVVVKKTITTPVDPLPIPPVLSKPVEPPKPIEPPKPVEKPVVLPKPPEKVVEVKPLEVQVPKEVVQEAPKVVPKEVPKPVVAEVPVELPPAPTPAPAPVVPAAVVATPAATASAAAPAAEPAKTTSPAVVVSAPAAPAAPTFASPTGPVNRGINLSNNAPNNNGSNTPASPGTSLNGFVVNPPGRATGGGGTASGLNGSGPGYQSGRCRGGFCGSELADRARAQLNPNKRPENYEIEFQNAVKKDCMKEGSLQVVARLLNGDCPK